MNDSRRPPTLTLAFALTILVPLAAFTPTREANARLAANASNDAQPPTGADDLDDDMEPEQAVPVVQQFAIDDSNFEMWLFGGGRNLQSARTKLDQQLKSKIDELDRTCGMSDAQKDKLRLAGRGDVKRFFDKVAEKKRRFDELKHDQQRIGEIFQEIQPLQLVFNAGLFGEGSIFTKSVKNTLNAEQTDKFAKINRDRDLFRYGARVDLVVSMLDNSVGFSAAQRKAFVKVLLAETKPPKRFGQYDTTVVLVQASKIPEAKLRPLFDDAQWRVVSRQFNQAKGMEPFLRSNGFLPDDKPAGGDAPQPKRAN